MTIGQPRQLVRFVWRFCGSGDDVGLGLERTRFLVIGAPDENVRTSILTDWQVNAHQ